MEEIKKQNQSDKELAEFVLIKPLFYLFFKPTEKFFQFWGVKYTINPKREFGSMAVELGKTWAIPKISKCDLFLFVK